MNGKVEGQGKGVLFVIRKEHEPIGLRHLMGKVPWPKRQEGE